MVNRGTTLTLVTSGHLDLARLQSKLRSSCMQPFTKTLKLSHQQPDRIILEVLEEGV